MLILRRKKSESILIGDNIRITVVDCAADGVRLAIDAPKQISILREELSKAEQENKNSVAPDFDTVSNLQNTLLARLKPALTHTDDKITSQADDGRTASPTDDDKTASQADDGKPAEEDRS